MIYCKVSGCSGEITLGTRKGQLCSIHWSQKTSSTLFKTIDDPNSYGGDPEIDDPSLDEIWLFAMRIRQEKESLGSKPVPNIEKIEHRLRLPKGMSIKDFEEDYE